MEYDDNFIDNVAKRTYEEGSGGRGIRNSLEKLFENIYERIIFEDDGSLVDENGKIVIKATADDDNNLLIKGNSGKEIYNENTRGKVKVKK